MAELPNSPPSAKARPVGPVFHKDVAKVRVSSGGQLASMSFDGKTYERGGEMVSVSELGWDHDTLAAAEADPHVVIERYDKHDKLIKKDGAAYPTVGDLTPKAAPKKES